MAYTTKLEKANAAKEKRLLRFQVVFAVRRVRGSPYLILIFFLFQCLDEAVKAGRRTVAPKQRDKDLGWIAAVIKARDKVVKVNALDSRSSPRTVNVPQCDSCVCGRQERLDSQDVVGYIVKAINMNRLRSETVCMDLLMCCSRNLMRDRLEGGVWCGFGEVSWCLIRCFQL